MNTIAKPPDVGLMGVQQPCILISLQPVHKPYYVYEQKGLVGVMPGKHVGYVRVSSVGQTSDRQLDCVKLDKVFEEKVSGRHAGSREVLNLCLDYLREHDTLHVHSIDRLARNMSDLLSIVDDLVKRDVTVKFHSEKLTFAPQTEDPMASLMLHMLGAFAEFERSLIGQRRKEGLEAARKRGKQIGRQKSLSDEDVSEIAHRLSEGVSKSDLAKEYGISRTTLYAALNRSQEVS